MELGIGLLGTRFMGKAHSHAYKSITTFMGLEVKPRLVAIYGRDPENTRYVASAYGYEKYYLDWRKLIKDPDVEVVDNSLPNFLHKDPCVEALESGKSVICEKPLARSLDEALEMLRAARKSGMVHGIIFNKRWFPAVQLAKKFIDEGLLGKILHFRFAYHQDWGADKELPLTWRFKKKTAGYGVLGDQGSHVIDMVRFLIGDVESVIATCSVDVKKRKAETGDYEKVDVEDSVAVLMKLKNGAFGVMEASRYSLGRKNYFVFEIYGEEGSIYFDMERLNELWLFKHNNRIYEGFTRIFVTEKVHPFYEKFWPAGHTIGWVESFILQLYHFLLAVKKGEEFKPNFYDGAVVNAIMDAVYESMKEKKWVKVKEVL